jgi:hypothetical protein
VPLRQAVHLAQRAARDEDGAAGGHAEQQPRRRALGAGQVPGPGKQQAGDLDRAGYREEGWTDTALRVRHLRQRLPPALAVGKAALEQQVGHRGRPPPRFPVERAPQCAHFAQQRPGLPSRGRGLVGQQRQAELVQLCERLERRGAEPRGRAPRILARIAVNPALQQHGVPCLHAPDGSRAARGRQMQFGVFLPNFIY